jgi:hypothetical protein
MKKKTLKKEIKDFKYERSLMELSIRVLTSALKKSNEERETLKQMYVSLVSLKDGLENRIQSLESNSHRLESQIHTSKEKCPQEQYEQAIWRR